MSIWMHKEYIKKKLVLLMGFDNIFSTNTKFLIYQLQQIMYHKYKLIYYIPLSVG